jgi:hypothetical protein
MTQRGFELLADAIIDDVVGHHVAVAALVIAAARSAAISTLKRTVFAVIIRISACRTIEVRSEMESTAAIGNGGSNILQALIRIRHLQCVGCDRKILWPSVGLQLGFVGAGWSSLGLLAFWKCNPKKTASRLRSCVAKRASSGLELQIVGLAALGPPRESFLKNRLLVLRL